jgi:heterodisulfide reductase subunit A2
MHPLRGVQHVCPVVKPNEFDAGMAARKAIYTPIPQSVPGAYLIDMASCLNQPPNYLPCSHCVQACPPKAINFMMPPQTILTRDVGAVILATGYDMLEPGRLVELGYGTHPDILSALEFERLVNSAGPTGGEIVRPSNGAHPGNLLIVLCVGSRDARHAHYCSRFCCMYSLKHAYQALDHGLKDVTVLAMDVRAYGKGFDGFWKRTQEAGAKFVRGHPARIQPNGDGRLHVHYEDLAQAASTSGDFDMVVLANAVLPPASLVELAQRLGIALDEDGFVKAQEEQGGLVLTTRTGVYAAGCVCGPKDIPDSVSEGSGAAALALSHVHARTWHVPPELPEMMDVETPRIGVFVCHCGSNIAGVVDVKAVAEYARTLPGVVYTGDQMFSCAGNTQKEIEEAIVREQLNRVVIAACSPKTHESIFRDVLVRSGVNPYLLEMANIRNMDSWVHKAEADAATHKAMDMVSMAVEKTRRLLPLSASHLEVAQRVLVIGGGLAGMTAAAALAQQGFETHLVEAGPQLGGMLLQLDEIAPSGVRAADLLAAKANELTQAGVRLHMDTLVEAISGVVGDFQAQLSDGEALQAGAVVIATGSAAYQPWEFGYGEDARLITNLELEGYLQQGSLDAERITFIACVGSRQDGTGCSRYCCTSMMGQALRLQRMGKRVRVLFKEMRTYSRQAEELYEAAMRSGVRTFRYPADLPPQEAIEWRDGELRFHDEHLGTRVRLPSDLVVLVVGLTPVEDGLSEQLKLARSEDGFYMELHPKLGPVETAVQGVYLAGTSQGAKDVRESVAGALAAAGKAGALLSRGEIEKEPLTAHLIPELCVGCMRCVKVCPFSAIEQIGKPGKDGTVRILEAACMGCGTCAAECNFDAIQMPMFTRAQIIAQIEAALEQDPQDKCLVFACNWCSYAGADLAGIEKRQYPASALVIRTMCSARLEEAFIERAFDLGAGAVLVTGCRLTDTGSDCHYNYANRQTFKRFQHWQRKFERKGVVPERLQLRWISAAEGKEFAEKISEMHQVVLRYASEKDGNGASRVKVEGEGG